MSRSSGEEERWKSRKRSDDSVGMKHEDGEKDRRDLKRSHDRSRSRSRSLSPERSDRDRDRSTRKRSDRDDRKSRESRKRDVGDGKDRKRTRKGRRRSDEDDDEDTDSSSHNRRERSRRKRGRSERKKRSGKKRKMSRKKRRSCSPSSESESESESSSSSSDENDAEKAKKTTKVVNQKLLAKLNSRGETLQERKERRLQKRAAKITARFGYTAEENPFNDPNLHETFTWTKKKKAEPLDVGKERAPDTLEEIENIRRRREERQREQDEMERLRAEESRMKELEHYDDWVKKEEEFHLQQQRQRSAIRLVEGREKPIDVLAKNLLLFGLSDEEKKNRAAVKYKEKYNVLEELEALEAELDEPSKLLTMLTKDELRELMVDIDSFRTLEREAFSSNPSGNVIRYWDALHLVAQDEMKLIDQGGSQSKYADKILDIRSIFKGQSKPALMKMKEEAKGKLQQGGTVPSSSIGGVDTGTNYWRMVLEQIDVYMAKLDLSDLHSKMLVRQLEKLEQKKEDLLNRQTEASDTKNDKNILSPAEDAPAGTEQQQDFDLGNLDEELGLTDEVDISNGHSHAWEDKFRPRKPRYFNRVKTGYDWNKYNQTHYDHDNPPPKTVQGYKFNIFYPDLVDPTKSPQYFLEPADSDDFCILRFHAGAPYEDVAFKILNREWNRSRKRGFRCTFERGVLSLYFNFTSHWYRR